ncbi:RNA polymerase sigma-70 factor [Membranihabitans maritimus]|uniref:RNA polymerase sigma-70 factor n=1 Tax=Membranihabitans maritimus TaxID=2904244 RepID=UPI001F01D75F|nr:RNA polymerase sigma-70 factor [Membranihabitans maritimus]
MSDTRNIHDDLKLVKALNRGDRNAFKRIYELYWERLFAYVYNRMHDRESSEEALQEVFLSLWENRYNLKIKTSLSSYLYSSVKYKMLNIMRSKKVRAKYAKDFGSFAQNYAPSQAENLQNLSDLKNLIENSLSTLPPKCQLVYRMSRQEHIPNQEIADQLHISKKTVENHLTKALKHLRMHLTEYNTILILCLLYFAGN